MYLLLFVFGGLLIAAGVALVGAGVSVQDHTFDPTVVTPGVVAAVGGLLLIGLGLALRVLQRIERAVALRAAPQGARLDGAMVATGPLAEAARIPLPPPMPTSRGQPASAAPAMPGVTSADATKEGPATARVESAHLAEQGETVPASKSVVPPTDEQAGEAAHVRAALRKNGATPPRGAPRLDGNARAPVVERGAGPAFDSLWPKAAPRPTRIEQPAAAEPPLVAPPIEPAPSEERAVPAAPAPATPQPISVLKSGIVDGMAYTLYSDGSIEAQLPQGKLRFGSITELRNHIEQSA